MLCGLIIQDRRVGLKGPSYYPSYLNMPKKLSPTLSPKLRARANALLVSRVAVVTLPAIPLQ